MENIVTEQEEIQEKLKRLTSEELKEVIFVVDWISTASKAETRKFGEIIATQDKEVIEKFIDSLMKKSQNHKATSSKMEVAAI